MVAASLASSPCSLLTKLSQNAAHLGGNNMNNEQRSTIVWVVIVVICLILFGFGSSSSSSSNSSYSTRNDSYDRNYSNDEIYDFVNNYDGKW